MALSDICFVSYKLYPYLNPGSSEMAGGAERQQFLIASELVDRGYEVSAVVGDHGQPEHELINQIDVWRSYKTVGNSGYKSLRGLLRLPEQITRLLYTMHKADANIYYTRSSIYYPILYIYSMLFKRPYVCGISHDLDVDPSSLGSKNPIYRTFYLQSLKSAQQVVTQTTNQKEQLEENLNINSIIIPNGYNIPDKYENNLNYFLWVGRAEKDPKNPEGYLDLAKNIPEEEFVMIVAPGQDNKYFRFLKTQAEKIPNVQFKGFVPPDEIQRYYENAIALVNTAFSEGFPNTFLEAWCVGTPVLSLYVNPDQIINEQGIGIISGSIKKLINDARIMSKNKELNRNLGNNARSYAKSKHSIDIVADKFEDHIL